MVGFLRLVDLEVHAVIGILPHERERNQPLFFNIDMEVDYTEILSNTGPLSLDYAVVAEQLKARVIEKQYGLIEALLVDCGQMLMQQYPILRAITLRVGKPQAILDCRTVEAILSLKR